MEGENGYRKIREKIKNRNPKPMDIKKKYAVLIPIVNNKGKLEIIYEVRAKDLVTQPGEISFPGERWGRWRDL